MKDRNIIREHANSGNDFVLARASNVEQRQVNWLWNGRLAAGKLTLIGGDPDLGKSLIAADIAARISAGKRWPDGRKSPKGAVAIVSAEDAPSDTICPRLEIAGANLRRVRFLRENGTGSFSLKTDLDRLANEIHRVGGIKLIVIDPITSYLGAIDSHKTSEVRGLLKLLDRFAHDNDVAVLAITHPPKSPQAKPINAFTGSLAFVAAARLVFIVIQEPGTNRSLLLSVKNNVGPRAKALGFTIEGAQTAKGIAAPRLVWDNEPVNMTAEQAMLPPSLCPCGARRIPWLPTRKTS